MNELLKKIEFFRHHHIIPPTVVYLGKKQAAEMQVKRGDKLEGLTVKTFDWLEDYLVVA